MRIEWDSQKAKSNLRKHGVSFEEAATAINDPIRITPWARIDISLLGFPPVVDSW